MRSRLSVARRLKAPAVKSCNAPVTAVGSKVQELSWPSHFGFKTRSTQAPALQKWGSSVRYAATLRSVKQDVDALIAKHKVFVVSKGFCPHCLRTKDALNALGVEYEVLELQDEAGGPLYADVDEVQDLMKEKTGARSVPRVFIGGKFVGGADDTLAKAASGELLELLGAAGATASNLTKQASEPTSYPPYVPDASTVAAAEEQAKLAKVKVGDRVPAGVAFDKGFPPTQVPGYLARQAELKAHGVTDVAVYCVNDGAVMTAWGQDQGIQGSMIQFLGDPRREVTEALGVVLDHPGPMGVLGTKRCKRFSMLIDDGIIKAINIAANEHDPAGDDNPAISLVGQILNQC